MQRGAAPFGALRCVAVRCAVSALRRHGRVHACLPVYLRARARMRGCMLVCVRACVLVCSCTQCVLHKCIDTCADSSTDACVGALYPMPRDISVFFSFILLLYYYEIYYKYIPCLGIFRSSEAVRLLWCKDPNAIAIQCDAIQRGATQRTCSAAQCTTQHDAAQRAQGMRARATQRIAKHARNASQTALHTRVLGHCSRTAASGYLGPLKPSDRCEPQPKP